MSASPYEHTLFLDADTYICDNINELFDLLELFDLALAHDTFRLFDPGYFKLRNIFLVFLQASQY